MNQAEKLRLSENREITALRREARKLSKKGRKHHEAAIKELKFKRKYPGLYNRGYYHNVVLG